MAQQIERKYLIDHEKRQKYVAITPLKCHFHAVQKQPF